MMRWMVAIVLMFESAVAAGSLPAPEDFAYGVPLIPREPASVYELALPAAVYQSVTRADLGDVRVFNANGEIVPHGLSAPPTRPVSSPVAPLPFFPLQTEAVREGELSMRLGQEAAKTVFELSLDEGAEIDGARRRYLLDARFLERPVEWLDLRWEPLAEGFFYEIEVERSDDLRVWQPLVRNAAIADLAFGGHRLQRRRIELPAPSRADFYRLSLRLDQVDLILENVLAGLTADIEEPVLQWSPVTITADDAQVGDYYFQMPVAMPVRKFRIGLPQPNTLVQASVYSRSSTEVPWKLRGRGLLYRLTVRGTWLSNAELPITQAQNRHWLLRIDQAGGGLGSGLPEVKAGWCPHILMFVARGDSPFTLAYGSARVRPTETGTNALLQGIDGETAAGLISREVRAGERMKLGGADVLSASSIAIDWKQWLLWALLVAGVGLLAWMAQRLLRELNAGR